MGNPIFTIVLLQPSCVWLFIAELLVVFVLLLILLPVLLLALLLVLLLVFLLIVLLVFTFHVLHPPVFCLITLTILNKKPENMHFIFAIEKISVLTSVRRAASTYSVCRKF